MRLEVLYHFEVTERLGKFVYRGVRALDGSLRVEKKGPRTGAWQPVLKQTDEAGAVRHYLVMTRNIAKPSTETPPAWLAERILQ